MTYTVNLHNFDFDHVWIAPDGGLRSNFDFGPGPLVANYVNLAPDGKHYSDAEFRCLCLLLVENLFASVLGAPIPAGIPAGFASTGDALFPVAYTVGLA